MQAGAWDQAFALCEARSDLDDPSVRLCRAIAEFAGGDATEALRELTELREAFPEHLSARAIHAQMLIRSGDRSAAIPPLLELVERYPNYPGACGLLAGLLMPGPSYLEVLARLHDRLKPRTYLEIGVESGKSLALARYSTAAIGIDPSPHVPDHALPEGARLFAETSDAFFGARSRASVLGARRVDLCFVDGMHRFENALSDFAHCESFSNADGTIVLHDCLPIVEPITSRERATNFWVGDTWKVVLSLARYRPDLRLRTIPCPPSGLIVIRGLNPASAMNKSDLGAITAEFAQETWRYAPGRAPPEFQLVSNDERGLLDAIG